MDNQKVLSIRLELLWWIATLVVVTLVLYPIYRLEPSQFPFWKTNIIFIIVFITLTRYVFLLKHTFLGYIQWMKVAVIVLCIPLIFYLINQLHFFQDYMDKIGLEEVFDHLTLNGQTAIISYINNEMIFFGVGSLICSVFLPFRMLISFWRMHNRGTV